MTYSNACLWLGTKNIRIGRGTGSLWVTSQGISCPFLKTFATVLSDPTDRPWVSEDDILLARYALLPQEKYDETLRTFMGEAIQVKSASKRFSD